MADSANLIQAVKEGNLDAIRKQLAGDSSLVHSRDEDGVSALMFSVYRMRPDVTQLLLDNGAEPAFHEAAALNLTDRLSAFLAQSPALLNAPAKDGFPALTLACFFGAMDAVDLLLRSGADPNIPAQNKMRVTALHSAVANRDLAKAERLVRMLLAHHANPNVKQEGALTPLHHPAALGHKDLARILMEHGADPNAAADNGKTPIYLARENGHADLVELLSNWQASK